MSAARPENRSSRVSPLAGALGALIEDVDLTRMDAALLAEVRGALRDHGVVFFRDQSMTPDEQVAVARRFGAIVVNRFFQPVDGHPLVAEVRKEPRHAQNIGGGWHTDHSYDEVPALGSLLYALEVPESGGDTLFASTAAAYQALSEGMQSLLRKLSAVHSSRHVFGAGRYREYAAGEYDGRLGNAELAVQDAVHPVVIVHPESKRPCLYVNPGFTVRLEGWTEEESRPLLEYLYGVVKRPEHTCRFRWERGSVALWDNRATWHYALNDYPGQTRLMHRVTLAGQPLAGA